MQSHLGWMLCSLEFLYSPCSHNLSFLIPLWISLFPGVSALFWRLFFLLAVSGDDNSSSLWTIIITTVDCLASSIYKTCIHLSVLMLVIGYHQYNFILKDSTFSRIERRNKNLSPVEIKNNNSLEKRLSLQSIVLGFFWFVFWY